MQPLYVGEPVHLIADRFAQGGDAEAFVQGVRRWQDAPELFAHLLHALVRRGRSFHGVPEVAAFSQALRTAGEPLGQLPLALTPIEARLGQRTFDASGSSTFVPVL